MHAFLIPAFIQKTINVVRDIFLERLTTVKKSAGQCPSVYNTVQNYVSRRLRRKRTRGNPIFGIAKSVNNFFANSKSVMLRIRIATKQVSFYSSNPR